MQAVLDALAIAVQARIPVLLWGAPGTGKTSVLRQLGEALGLPVEVVIASIREPTDFLGLPVAHGDSVRFLPPKWAVRLGEEGRGLLFFDDITAASPAVQAALLRVVLERVVGEYALPEGVAVAAAANRGEDAAWVWELGAPLANRFLHLEWGCDYASWAAAAVGSWALPAVPRVPEHWHRHVSAAIGEITAFLRSRPGLLLAPPAAGADARGWPSPRSWELAARALGAARAAGASAEVEALLVEGAVGPGAAAEFLHWRTQLDLPPIEEVLRDPWRAHLPGREDQLFALVAGAVSAATAAQSKEHWRGAWELMLRVCEERAPDLALLGTMGLVRSAKGGRDVPGDLAPRLLRHLGPLAAELGLCTEAETIAEGVS